MRRTGGPASSSTAASWFGIVAAAAILLWPAILNGYPLLFGDTGVYIKDGNHIHVTWARPMFYGLFMRPLHLRLTVWPVIAAQGLIAATMLQLAVRTFVPAAPRLALIPVTIALALGTSLPWFVSQLMPDVFAGLLVLALAALTLAPERFGRIGRLALMLFAAFCITMHLSLLPLCLAALVVLWLARLWLGRGLGAGDLMRGTAIPLLAVIIITLPNAALLGKVSPSPYGKIFILTRLIADGPARRVLERECPQPDWTLCAFKDELGDNSDAILWGPGEMMRRAGGQDAVVQQAGPIIAATLRAEPGAVALDALRNTAAQFVSFASGDELLKRSPFNDDVWSQEFPAAEQARYHAGRQFQLHELIPSWMQALHIGLGFLSILFLTVAAWWAMRRREVIGGLYLVIPAALLANAFVAGALSGVFDRYQSRLVWLAPFAVLLFLLDRRRAASPEPA